MSMDAEIRGHAKTYKGKSMRPGGGGRFAKGRDELMRKGMSAASSGAVMAARGRKRYGEERMAKWAERGRKREER